MSDTPRDSRSKQLGPELLLEPRDVLRDGGLREAQRLRRGRERAACRDLAERLQEPQIEHNATLSQTKVDRCWTLWASTGRHFTHDLLRHHLPPGHRRPTATSSATSPQLDSQRLSDDGYTVAEINGRIVAALNRADGSAIADPFQRTAEIVRMLRAHVGTATVSDTRRHLSVRRLRTALA